MPPPIFAPLPYAPPFSLISRCRNFAESSLAKILNLKTEKDAKLTVTMTKGNNLGV